MKTVSWLQARRRLNGNFLFAAAEMSDGVFVTGGDRGLSHGRLCSTQMSIRRRAEEEELSDPESSSLT